MIRYARNHSPITFIPYGLEERAIVVVSITAIAHYILYAPWATKWVRAESVPNACNPIDTSLVCYARS